MLDRVAAETVKFVLPETPFKDADIVVVPKSTAVASPVVVIVPTDVAEDDQVTEEVIFAVVPSL